MTRYCATPEPQQPPPPPSSPPVNCAPPSQEPPASCAPCSSDNGTSDSHHGALISADVDFGHGGLSILGDIAGLDVNADVATSGGLDAHADIGHLLDTNIDLGLGLFDSHCA